jgi:hypothetical protein
MPVRVEECPDSTLAGLGRHALEQFRRPIGRSTVHQKKAIRARAGHDISAGASEEPKIVTQAG